MQLLENVSLLPYNTFGLEAKARYFAEVTSPDELRQLLLAPRWQNEPKLVLGGGSNVLLTQDINALVIRIAIKGIEKIKEDQEHVWLRVGAGEWWHDLVMYSVGKGYSGLENLSLIPGTVGAAPMQNIGAYGVEIREVFEELEAIHIQTADLRQFGAEECRFGYRESVFKRDLRGQYIITSVTFRLSKVPSFRTSYGDIQKTLADMNVEELSTRAISEAVIRIRQSKLPDPAQIGNAGSFFKNPEIPKAQFNQLREQYPAVPGYDTAPDRVKVPAGWLIEQAGWKGFREGQVGVHARQALVLVNYGGGTGEQIKELAGRVQDSVEEKFGIRLTPEVNFI
ncbi:UDP-N-acetylmuramate dehydrogenase [Telluribacter sp.]|jgi:UDP-N-acetylmuramate dehydrogenase|uniref:UDP-N-acetylmuramate dehydrogenase n=1 Tax=Telluribacter sp. TaxID=1978767 RepID=UPI002E135CB3|nr:UDP-N-acetylmuramate dehydrogenase [Telluribacter sp.]